MFRDRAVALAEKGFRVFKLLPNGKTPACSGFFDVATANPRRVHEMWTCPVSGDTLHNNIGVATGRGLVVIDVDVKHGRIGMSSLWTLVERHKLRLRGRYMVRTPSGGLHLYVWTSKEALVPNAANRWPGIDVRGHHGYVVGAGSTIDGRSYEEI